MSFYDNSDTKLTNEQQAIESLTIEISELRNLNSKLSTILDFSMDMICTVDEEGIFISVSKASYNILGYTPEELIGKPQSEFTYHEDHAKTHEARRKVVEGFSLTNFENRYIHKNGSIVPLVWSSRWVPEEKLRYGIARDATEKVKADEAIRNSEKKYKQLFQNNPAPMIIWEFQTLNIIDCNEEALNKYGYLREEFLKLNIRQIRPPEDIHLIEEITKNETDFTKKHRTTWRHLKKNGELMIIDLTGHIIDYNGKRCAIVMINDVTDNVNLHEALEKQKLALEVSNKELEQFAYIASHDLQEPLRMVTGFVSLLMKKYGDKLDKTAQIYINHAIDGAERMKILISDLLEYSRAGIKDDRIIEINLKELINDLIALHKNQVADSPVNFQIGDLPVINCHRSPIRQIFQNLISNAIKYKQPDIATVIEINCEDDNDFWCFSIKDNGIGIAAENFERVFVIFQRLHSKSEYSGTGIGLAMAKKIVESLGGKIWVRSVLMHGSTFYFTLPK